MKYNFSLEQGLVDYILNVLAEKPYMQVAPVIGELSNQIAEQNDQLKVESASV